jgi:hypothetical protein
MKSYFQAGSPPIDEKEIKPFQKNYKILLVMYHVIPYSFDMKTP